jgi:hypothetical protein
MIDTNVINIQHRARRSKSSVVIDEPVWELRRAAEGMRYWIPAFSVDEKSADIFRSAENTDGRALLGRRIDAENWLRCLVTFMTYMSTSSLTRERAPTLWINIVVW